MSKYNDGFAGDLDGQTVLVTGTTKGGIGHETAQGLGNAGATVLVHARNDRAASTAAGQLAQAGNGRGSYQPVAGDLGSLAGVHQLAAAVRDAVPKGLHGLVNNAGAAFAKHTLSPDGYEMTIAVNHVAPAALTEDLLDLLRAGADTLGVPSRVINMTTLIEGRGKPVEDWAYPGKYKQIRAYADAKLLNLLYTYAQSRRTGTGVTFNAVSPGSVNSGFGGKAGGPIKTMQALSKPFVGPPAKGARGCIRLMVDPALAEATGGYYSAAKLKKSSKQSRDIKLQDKTFAQTERVLHHV
jgi:retinol dehydrogenase 12